MDFLTRLADRQRAEHHGVRPQLPSRFESDSTGPDPVELAPEPASEPAPGPRWTERPPGPAPVPPEPPVAAPAPAEPNARRAAPARGLSTPDPRPAATRGDSAAPPTPARAWREPDQPTVPTGPRTVLDPAAQQRPDHRPTPPPPAVPVRREPATSVVSEPATAAASLPSPMLAPIPAPVPAVPVTAPRETAHRPTVSISIGRVELRPPAAAPTPASVAVELVSRPSEHRPRLTLEDYLARPNRGRR